MTDSTEWITKKTRTDDARQDHLINGLRKRKRKKSGLRKKKRKKSGLQKKIRLIRKDLKEVGQTNARIF